MRQSRARHAASARIRQAARAVACWPTPARARLMVRDFPRWLRSASRPVSRLDAAIRHALAVAPLAVGDARADLALAAYYQPTAPDAARALDDRLEVLGVDAGEL